jgi:hypothetical protein
MGVAVKVGVGASVGWGVVTGLGVGVALGGGIPSPPARHANKINIVARLTAKTPIFFLSTCNAFSHRYPCDRLYCFGALLTSLVLYHS